MSRNGKRTAAQARALEQVVRLGLDSDPKRFRTDLYGLIAVLAGLSEGDEVLEAGCGDGTALEELVRRHRVLGSGVDAAAERVGEAETRARGAGLADRLQFQHAPLDALPYRNEVFDLAIGQVDVAASEDPATAIAELARVTRPGGTVAVVQMVWTAPVDEPRQAQIAGVLGARPLMLVEWKRLLAANGVENLHTVEWPGESVFAPGGRPERGGVHQVARTLLGLGRQMMGRGEDLRAELGPDGVMALVLIKGTRVGAAPRALGSSERADPLVLVQAAEDAPSAPRRGKRTGPRARSRIVEVRSEQVQDLPLFTPKEGELP